MDLPIPNEKRGCRFTGFTRKCRDLVLGGECEHWCSFEFTVATTGEKVKRWGCDIDFVHDATMIAAAETCRTRAATESFRNEFQSSHHETIKMAAVASQDRERDREVLAQISNGGIALIEAQPE